MSSTKKSRRVFLATTAAGVVGVGAIGYVTRGQWLPGTSAVPDATPLNLESALQRLVRVLGPWRVESSETANDFTNRYLSKSRIEAVMELEEHVLSLASRFSAEDVAIERVPLGELPAEERKLVVRLTKELYATDEVRAYMRKYPPVGSCVGDINRHTIAPS